MSTASPPNQLDEKSATEQDKKLSDFTNGSFATWSDFLAELKSRKLEATWPDLWPGRRVALQWGLPSLSDEKRVPEPLVRAVQRLAAGCRVKPEDKDLVDSLMDVAKPADDAKAEHDECEFKADPIASVPYLALATLMPHLAAISDQGSWCRALSQLIALCESLESTASEKDDATVDCSEALRRQWQNVELPLLLAYQFPVLPECKALAESAFDTMIVEQEELLDSDGTIAATCVGRVPAFLATWVRSIVLAGRLDLKLDGQSQEKWEWFLRFAMRLLRKDGTSMLAKPSVAAMPELFAAAIATSTDKEDRAIAQLVIPAAIEKTTKANKEHKKKTKASTKSSAKQKAGKKQRILIDHGTYSEWAGVAILQTDWSPKSPRIPIAFEDDRFQMEVCRGKSLFQLLGHPDISVYGKPLKPIDDWEEVCWNSDEDVDYLEVEVHYENDVRLQRQVCLLRADDALYVADAVLTNDDHRIDYEASLYVDSAMNCLQESENNEVYLRDDKQKIRSLLLPLALSEWKKSATDDEIKLNDNHLVLKKSTMGRNLYAPWLIDLSPKRSIKPRTWRALTVGEGLEIVSPDVAQSFRIRIGDQQWVIYRSLAEVSNRTFLGQNRNCEFFIGRFKEDGDVDELLSIE